MAQGGVPACVERLREVLSPRRVVHPVCSRVREVVCRRRLRRCLVCACGKSSSCRVVQMFSRVNPSRVWVCCGYGCGSLLRYTRDRYLMSCPLSLLLGDRDGDGVQCEH
jgi:hypothetical protein